MKEKLRNKKVVYTIIGIVSVLLVALAVTYAYWLVTKTQTGENEISSACLDISLTDEKNDIALLEQYPISDEEGMKLVPYEFTVTNNCNTSVDYQVALEIFDTGDTVIPSAIKVMLDEDVPVILSAKNTTATTIGDATNAYILKTGSLSGAGTTSASESHTLRIWIDENAPISEMNKIFESQISVTVGQGIENPVICKAVTEETRLQDQHYAFSHIDQNNNTVLATELSYIGNIPEGKHEPGDEYLCEVKPGTTYRFYVLSTNNAAGEIITESSTDKEISSVNLIMDQNITSDGTPATSENSGTVHWISDEDYGCGANGTNCAVNDKGPITAMKFLTNAVSNWIYIGEKEMNYTSRKILGFESEPYNPVYSDFEYYNFSITSRARMINYEEAYAAGCLNEVNRTNSDGSVSKFYYDTCPLWLTNNLQFKRDTSKGEIVPIGANVIANGPRGYWMNNYTNISSTAFEVLDHGNLNSKEVYKNDYNGVRPVITVDLSDLDI